MPDEEVFGPLLNVWRWRISMRRSRLANNTRLVRRVGWCRRIARASSNSLFAGGAGRIVNWNKPSPGQREYWRRLRYRRVWQPSACAPGMPPIIAPADGRLESPELTLLATLSPVSTSRRGGGMAHEVNFDGLVGLTHHYAGLSFGNEASTSPPFSGGVESSSGGKAGAAKDESWRMPAFPVW